MLILILFQNELIFAHYTGSSNDSSKLFVLLHRVISELKESPLFANALSSLKVPGRSEMNEEHLRRDLSRFLHATSPKQKSWHGGSFLTAKYVAESQQMRFCLIS